MKQVKNILLLAVLIMSCNNIIAQCADAANIYSFVYNGQFYEVVKENRSWTDASSCAVSRNGYLAEINDAAEQNAVLKELTDNAGIITSNTQNEFGIPSIWLGGSDAVTEGDWIWDGDNDGIGPQFWSGGPDGNGSRYSNWGTSPAEPDNFNGQDHLSIIIEPPVNFGLWNDLLSTRNSIYYLIEYSPILSIQNSELRTNISIYPNPFKNFITVDNKTSVAIDRIDIFNLMSQKIKTFNRNEIINNEINVASLDNGMYILRVHFDNGEIISQKIVK